MMLALPEGPPAAPPPTGPPPAPPSSANGANGRPSSWTMPIVEPSNDNGGPELGAASTVNPSVDAGPDEFTDAAPPDIGAGPTVDPAAAAEEMNARIAALGPMEHMVAELLVGVVERNREVCEAHGQYWPRLSSRPEDAETWQHARDFYKWCCLYTLALFPVKPGKYTPVVVCVGGQVGSTVAVAVAKRAAAANAAPPENRPQSREQPELELERDQPRARKGPRRGWDDELGGASEAA